MGKVLLIGVPIPCTMLRVIKATTSTQGEPAHVHVDVQVRATKEFYNFKTLCLIYPALAT
jgi:hypothetical protein